MHLLYVYPARKLSEPEVWLRLACSELYRELATVVSYGLVSNSGPRGLVLRNVLPANGDEPGKVTHSVPAGGVSENWPHGGAVLLGSRLAGLLKYKQSAGSAGFASMEVTRRCAWFPT